MRGIFIFAEKAKFRKTTTRDHVLTQKQPQMFGKNRRVARAERV